MPTNRRDFAGLLPDPAQPRRDVLLLRAPLPLWLRAEEHSDELLREFALIQAGQAGGSGHPVPAELLALVEELGRAYTDQSEPADRQRAAAVAAGRSVADIVYRDVPVAAAAAATHTLKLLELADEFCRGSGQLLTLATTPLLADFRAWYLGEFVRQLAGEAPVPWAGPRDLS